jgi:hypothetical protein
LFVVLGTSEVRAEIGPLLVRRSLGLGCGPRRVKGALLLLPLDRKAMVRL